MVKVVPLVLVLLLAVSTAAAEKPKGEIDVSWFPFWTAKDQPLSARQHVPGLTAILGLSNAQKLSLAQAWQETMHDPALLELGRAVKLDPNATDEQRRAARQAYERAHGMLQSRVAAILTRVQKELILTTDLLHREAWAQVNSEIANAKANGLDVERLQRDAPQRLSMEFLERLNRILSPEQKAALERAAADENRREAEAAARKK